MEQYNLQLGGGTLLQVANRTPKQMMSYIIDTPDGGVVVIDGGNYVREDAECLYDYLAERGKRVNTWFMTHAHGDHIGALTFLMEREDFDLNIERVCLHFPDLDWIYQIDPNSYFLTIKFMSLLRLHNIKVITVYPDEICACAGVDVEVLSVPDAYRKYPNINSTSLILMVKYPEKEVLFLGDFDKFAQEEYICKHDTQKLRCDIVQMAHHGQGGVDKHFYEYIQPKVCLYPAPKWLWENNLYCVNEPETAGKGPFTTMETRSWMEELGVIESYTQENGDILFI